LAQRTALLALRIVDQEGGKAYNGKVEGKQQNALLYELEVERGACPTVKQLRQLASERQLPALRS